MLLLAVTCAVLASLVQAEVVILNELVTDLADVPGEWTAWLNNPYTQRKFGDFENVYKYRKYYNLMLGGCEMWCDDPVAVEYQVAPGFDAQAGECAFIELKDVTRGFYRGFNCYDYKQARSTCSRDQCVALGMYRADIMNAEANCNRCPDFTVRYYCTGDKAAQVAGCFSDADALQQVEQTREVLDQSADTRQQLLSRELDLQAEKQRELHQDERRRELVQALRDLLTGEK